MEIISTMASTKSPLLIHMVQAMESISSNKTTIRTMLHHLEVMQCLIGEWPKLSNLMPERDSTKKIKRNFTNSQ